MTHGMTNEQELARIAMHVACAIVDKWPYRALARRLARAALAGDTREMLYWLRLARGVGAAPEALAERASAVASRCGSAARAA